MFSQNLYVRYAANRHTYYYQFSITPHSFIPGLKPSFSAAIPSHRSLPFFSSGLATRIPQTVYCYF